MTSSADKIYLGSVQWGLPYGIANKTGQPGLEEVGRILNLAKQSGIKGIDTAYGYGDSELVIGELAGADSPFQIVTKLISLKHSQITVDHVSRVRDAFYQSLRRLRRESTYGLLVHHAADLLSQGGDLIWQMMEDIQNAGEATRIGVSVYSPDELSELAARYPLQLIQVPANIYDQRFLHGVLTPLRNKGCEVHARSIFLQGLLLQQPEDLPPYFSSLTSRHEHLLSYIQDAGYSMKSAALHFVLDHDCVDRVVLGFEQASQLEELLGILNQTENASIPLHSFAIDEENILNPSLWVSSSEWAAK